MIGKILYVHSEKLTTVNKISGVMQNHILKVMDDS